MQFSRSFAAIRDIAVISESSENADADIVQEDWTTYLYNFEIGNKPGDKLSMTYARKFTLLFILFFVTVASVAFLLRHHNIGRVADRFLEALAMKEAQRVVSILRGHESHLVSAADDWGHWDDLYRFAEGGDDTFLTHNFAQSDSLGKLNIDGMLFFDNKGRFLGGALKREGRSGVVRTLPKLFGKIQTLANKIGRGVHTIAFANGDIYLAAFAPILPTAAHSVSTPGGSFTMMLKVDASFFKAHGVKTLAVTASVPSVPTAPLADVNGMSASERYGYAYTGGTLQTTLYRPDPLGDPLTVTTVSHPSALIDSIRMQSMGALSVATLLFGAILLLLYRYTVRRHLRKFVRLEAAVAAIPDKPDMARKLPAFDEPDLQKVVDAVSATASRLQEQGEILQNILRHMPAGVVIYQPTVVYCNDYARTFVAWPEEKLRQMTPVDFLPKQMPPEERAAYEKMQHEHINQEGGVKSYELTTQTGRGEKRIYAVSSTISYKGKPAGIVSFIDITELRQTRRELDLVLHYAPLVVYHVRMEKDGVRVLYVSDAIEKLTGFSPETILENPSWWRNHIHPDDAGEVMARQERLQRQKRLHHTYRLQKADGSYLWVDDYVYLVEGQEGVEILGFWTPETESEGSRRMAEVLARAGEAMRDIEEQEAMLHAVCRLLVESALFKFVWIGRPETEKVVPICHAGNGTGYLDEIAITADEKSPLSTGPTGRALGRKLPLVINADTRSNPEMGPWREAMLKRGFFASAAALIATDREDLVLNLYSDTPGVFGGGMRDFLLKLAKDISLWSEYHRTSARMHYLSYHDALCGVPNINALLERLKTPAASLAVGVINISRFSNVNLNYGYETGNELLCAAAKKIRETIDEKDTVYRLGGDKFAIVMEGVTKTQAMEILKRVRRALASGVKTSIHTLPVHIRAGIAAYPEDTPLMEHLHELGMSALGYGKGGEGIMPFEPWMLELSHRRILLEAELEEAINQERFEIHYQPIVDAETGVLVQCESLLRLRDDEGRFIRPDLVVSVAEEVGLIDEVTRIVLKKVLSQVKAWQDAGLDIKAAVNLSAEDVAREDFFPILEETLLRNGLAGEVIALEITERTAIENMEAARIFIERAQTIGVAVEIDDFGVAHSSLHEIASIDFDLLKIDKSFIDHVVDHARSQKVVRFIIQLARELGARTIAEGVETPAQAAWLREAGCDMIQGYLYGRPMPAEDFKAWYNARKK